MKIFFCAKLFFCLYCYWIIQNIAPPIFSDEFSFSVSGQWKKTKKLRKSFMITVSQLDCKTLPLPLFILRSKNPVHSAAVVVWYYVTAVEKLDTNTHTKHTSWMAAIFFSSANLPWTNERKNFVHSLFDLCLDQIIFALRFFSFFFSKFSTKQQQ